MNHSHHNHGSVHADAKAAPSPAHLSLKDYIPLIVVFIFIFIASSTLVAVMGSSFANWMTAIMGYFFVFFALFKFLDLSGFKEGFMHYDIIAKKIPAWGYMYPFLELGLGVLYLLNFQNPWLHISTIVITALNIFSVALKLAKKEVFMCACLGTILKVPLTTVTLIEYGAMGAMAGIMLLA